MSVRHSIEALSVHHDITDTPTLLTSGASEVSSTRAIEHVYERVPETEPETEAPASGNTKSPSLDTAKEKTEEAREGTQIGALTKSPFQWWFFLPLDVILALSPLFFLGTNSNPGQGVTTT